MNSLSDTSLTNTINNLIEDELPWQSTIIEFTNNSIINSDKAFPSIIEELEQSSEDAIDKKKKEIYYSCFHRISNLLKNIHLLYNETPNTMSVRKLTLFLKKKVLQSIEEGYNPKLISFKAELNNLVTEFCSIMQPKEGFKNEQGAELQKSYNAFKQRLLNQVIYPIFYETVHFKELIDYVAAKLMEVESSEQHFLPPFDQNKLTWKVRPALAATVLYILQTNGFITGFTGIGERDAKLLLSTFDFEKHKPSVSSLGKHFQNLSKKIPVINPDDVAILKRIPKTTDLNRI